MRPFAVPLVGYGLGIVSVGAASVVVAIDLFDRSGSPAWAAVGAASRALPYVVGAPVGALIAERRNPRVVLAVLTAAQMVLAVALAATVGRAPLLVVAGIGFLANLAWSPCYATMASLVTRTVESQDLAAGTALFATTESIAFSVGPGIGGLLVTFASVEVAALAAAALGLVGAVVLGFPGGARSIRGARIDDERDPAVARFVNGLRAIRREPLVAGPLSLELVAMTVLGASQVLLLVAATEVIGMGKGGFGTLNAALSLGAFLAVFVSTLAAGARSASRNLVLASLVAGACFGLLAVGPPVLLAIGLLLLCGLGLTVTEVLAVTTIQRNLSETVLTRVFGVIDSLTVAAVLVGAAVAPVLVRLLGIEGSLVAVGLLAPVVAVLARRSLRLRPVETAMPLAELAPLADLLHGLPFLAAASRPAIEAMAARGRRTTVPAGTPVVRQGDDADDFYAIVSGSFDVVKTTPDGTSAVVATLGPGAGFGEVGLLARAPRNATVLATETSVLLRVPGNLLLRSVGTGTVTGGFGPTAAIVDRYTAG